MWCSYEQITKKRSKTISKQNSMVKIYLPYLPVQNGHAKKFLMIKTRILPLKPSLSHNLLDEALYMTDYVTNRTSIIKYN